MPKRCPFLNKDCLGADCALWMMATVKIVKDGANDQYIDYNTCALRLIAEGSFRQISKDVLVDFPGYTKWFD
jgi:hypothetical protein